MTTYKKNKKNNINNQTNILNKNSYAIIFIGMHGYIPLNANNDPLLFKLPNSIQYLNHIMVTPPGLLLTSSHTIMNNSKTMIRENSKKQFSENSTIASNKIINIINGVSFIDENPPEYFFNKFKVEYMQLNEHKTKIGMHIDSLQTKLFMEKAYSYTFLDGVYCIDSSDEKHIDMSKKILFPEIAKNKNGYTTFSEIIQLLN